MNKTTFESKTKKPLIHIPPYGGLGSFKIVYHHDLRKPTKNILKIILKLELQLVEEFTGDKKFTIMVMEYKYRVNIVTQLEVDDLTKIWFECAEDLVKTFNGFEKLHFGETHEILHSDTERLKPTCAPLVDWYNKLS